MRKEFYEKMGLNETCSQDEVKKAYRKKARELHPDHGGNESDFKELVKMYEVLSDPERREKYDNGEDFDKKDQKGDLYQTIIALFMQEIQRGNYKKTNILGNIRSTIKKAQSGIRTEIPREKKEISRFRDVMDRVIKKNKGESIFSIAIDSQIKKHQMRIKDLEKQIKRYDECLVILDDYDYIFDKVEPRVHFEPLINDDFEIRF